MKKVLLFLWLAGIAGATQKPNIIFIMVDDMGRDWVSCYGADHQTPNIDRLASQGVRYETAWCTPICTPTRVTLLTGQYPFHHGWVQHYDVPRWGGSGLRADRFTTFARPLRDSGYATAIGGKWQINHLRKEPDVLKKHGFDEHCVWPGVEEGHPETQERFWNGLLATNGKRNFIRAERRTPWHKVPHHFNWRFALRPSETPTSQHISRKRIVIGDVVVLWYPLTTIVEDNA